MPIIAAGHADDPASENPLQNEIVIEASRSGVRLAHRKSATSPVSSHIRQKTTVSGPSSEMPLEITPEAGHPTIAKAAAGTPSARSDRAGTPRSPSGAPGAGPDPMSAMSVLKTIARAEA